MNEKIATKVFALGGLGEVGKNMYCVEHGDEILIIDAGVIFPEEQLMGIDYVIPDYKYLIENKHKIKGLLITHGHEDHIGGIPFLLSMIELPVIWAPKQASALIKIKLEDRRIKYSNIKEINEDITIKFDNFSVEFFRTNHSIPDSHGMAITTSNGTIVETGDFKFDLTPIGPNANLHKMAAIGSKGVDLLLSDSTNSITPGFSNSESIVDDALGDIFDQETGRIIIATFASNIYRLKHITETCAEKGRKVAVLGRSMDNAVNISLELGYIETKDIFVDINAALKMPSEKVAILCTGSQGETLAALTRIANGSHRQFNINQNDVVIFSSSPIPGNEVGISNTINQLYLKGVKVYNKASNSDIHTSGHGYATELQLMLTLMKPKYFMPIHGEYRMLKRHSELGIECGVPKEKTFICGNGDVLELLDGVVTRSNEKVPTSDVYVDGNRIGSIGTEIIKERKTMANDGIVVITGNIDMKNNRLIGNPNITTRGFILINENNDLIKKISDISRKSIQTSLKESKGNFDKLKSNLTQSLGQYLFKETGCRPILLPLVMEIK